MLMYIFLFRCFTRWEKAESESGNLASAAEALRSALAVDPSHMPSALELGRAYRLKGDLERAALTLQQVCTPSLSYFFSSL